MLPARRPPSPFVPIPALLSRIDYALLERIERGEVAFAPADPQSRTSLERFNAQLEVLLFHEELGLLAVTQTGPDPADGDGPVRAVAELTEHGRRRLARQRAESRPEPDPADGAKRPPGA